MKPKNNSLPFIIAGIFALGGLGWYFLIGTEQPAISEGVVENRTQTKFQTLAGELAPISFDTSVFSDDRFNALIDLTTPIAPEPTGRPDPFASVAGVSIN
ncbi:MAG: hypothetical protein WC887_02800 [Candidatus Paceibacterota bacterium]|jgi:hypothetical protein